MDSGISVMALDTSGPFCLKPYGDARPADRAESAWGFEDVLTVTVPNGPVPAGRWLEVPGPALTVTPGARGSVRAYAVFRWGTWPTRSTGPRRTSSHGRRSMPLPEATGSS